MSDAAHTLADKLTAEGERTLAFFRALPPDAWACRVYEDGPAWTARDVLEHLVVSEAELGRLFERVASDGDGAEPGFDIDRFNREHTGRLATLSLDALYDMCAGTRRRTADFARGLTDEQLARRGRHPALGEAALQEMLKLIYVHHAMHLRDIRRAMQGRGASAG